MPHALLLSPDDQAVSAISGVLEEMSVTCERPLDGVSAAHKLNSESFDLVLVDCENLPAAKLIFDVCRRGKSGNNPVPIAIVDGRAGLPTAFRLGAELILTKPVAKDQARSTIRTAVGRLRKDLPTNEITEAAAASSHTASYAEGGPRFARGEVPPSYLTAALTASGFAADAKTTTTTTKMSDVADEEAAASASNPGSSSEPSGSSTEFEGAPSYRDDSSSDEGSMNMMNGQTSHLPKPNDDLVLAEIDRVENEKSALPNPQRLALATPANNSTRPYQRGGKQAHAALIAALMLTIAGGAFYGAWMYQPGFREIAQPQIDRLLNLAAKGLPPASKPSPARPSAQVAAAPTAAPAPQPASLPNSAAQTTITITPTATAVSDPVTRVATASTAPAPALTQASASSAKPTTMSASANVPQPAIAPSVAVAPPTPAAKSTPSPALAQAGAVRSVSPTNDNKEPKKDTAAAIPADTPLPGENTALILSSKGAEKRLAHSVPPQFPADASKSGALGPVVLKTVIDENGDVAGVRMVNGNAALAPAAIQAVKQWRYRPYVRDGKALPFQTVVIIDSQHH